MKEYRILVVIAYGRGSASTQIISHDSIEDAEQAHNATIEELRGNEIFSWGVYRMYNKPEVKVQVKMPEVDTPSAVIEVSGKRMISQLEEKHQ